MKKIITMLMALCLILGMCACSLIPQNQTNLDAFTNPGTSITPDPTDTEPTDVPGPEDSDDPPKYTFPEDEDLPTVPPDIDDEDEEDDDE